MVCWVKSTHKSELVGDTGITLVRRTVSTNMCLANFWFVMRWVPPTWEMLENLLKANRCKLETHVWPPTQNGEKHHHQHLGLSCVEGRSCANEWGHGGFGDMESNEILNHPWDWYCNNIAWSGCWYSTSRYITIFRWMEIGIIHILRVHPGRTSMNWVFGWKNCKHNSHNQHNSHDLPIFSVSNCLLRYYSNPVYLSWGLNSHSFPYNKACYWHAHQPNSRGLYAH